MDNYNYESIQDFIGEIQELTNGADYHLANMRDGDDVIYNAFALYDMLQSIKDTVLAFDYHTRVIEYAKEKTNVN